MSTSDSSPNAIDRFIELKDREWFVALGALIGLLVFPWFMIEGLGILADVLKTRIGGYQGLPELILIFGIAVVGFNLLLGYTGLLSFGHAAFFGGGAYAAGLLTHNGFLPPILTKSPILMAVAGFVLAILLAWPIGFLSIRRSGVYFAVLTLTFGQMLYFYAMGPGSWLTNGDDGFTPKPGDLFGSFGLDGAVPVLPQFTYFYLVVAVFTFVAILFAYRIINSPYGLIFKGLGQNEQRVSFVGLNVFRYKLMAFIISAAFVGAAGGLYATAQAPTIHPNGSLYWTVSGDFVIMSALGGVGTLFGPIFGAGIFEYIALVFSGVEIFGFELGEAWRLVLGAVFVLIVAVFPNGFYGGIRNIGSWIARRLGNQTGSAPPEEPAEAETASGGED